MKAGAAACAGFVSSSPVSHADQSNPEKFGRELRLVNLVAVFFDTLGHTQTLWKRQRNGYVKSSGQFGPT
jgi:hypothetical protein